MNMSIIYQTLAITMLFFLVNAAAITKPGHLNRFGVGHIGVGQSIIHPRHPVVRRKEDNDRVPRDLTMGAKSLTFSLIPMTVFIALH